MFLLHFFSSLSAHASQALLDLVRLNATTISVVNALKAADYLKIDRSAVQLMAQSVAQSVAHFPNLSLKTPTLKRPFSAWLRVMRWVHPTLLLTPCLLPVAAANLRENQHETHVIQRHPRRRNACSHC